MIAMIGMRSEAALEAALEGRDAKKQFKRTN